MKECEKIENLRYPDAIPALFTRSKIYHTASLPRETKEFSLYASQQVTQRQRRTHTHARAHTPRHLSQSYCSTRMNSNGRPRANKCQYALFPRRGGRRRWSVHTVNWLAVYLADNSRSSALQTNRWTDRQTDRVFFFFTETDKPEHNRATPSTQGPGRPCSGSGEGDNGL